MSTSNTGSRCPHCGREYERRAIPNPFDNGRKFYMTVRCDCPGAVAERERKSREEYEERRKAVFDRIGIPRRFADVEPNDSLLSHIDAGYGVYITGDQGRGKTYLAVATLKAWFDKNWERGGKARFMSFPAWLDRMSEAAHKWRTSEEDEFYRAVGVDLLVVDDLGKKRTKPNAWMVSRIFRLVDERYNSMKPTIFTTQYGTPELIDLLTVDGDTETPKAIVSRMYETCRGKRLDGPDRRLGHEGS
ncbi:MAG: ATP-binding protein [Atopobiaceae bacterium]|nr:ATP-binding protein [Atopobiaceae bacterium]